MNQLSTNKLHTRILGIDPGSRKMGYAVIEVGTSIQYIECGLLTTNTKKPLIERLIELGESLKEVINEFQPEEAAIEDVFSMINTKAALVLGQARGMALYILGSSGLNVSSYSPNHIKKYITGRGKADKIQVRNSVMSLANLSHPPPEDAADALAIAWCHALHMKQKNILYS